MINLKKCLITTLLLFSVCFNIFAQSTNETKGDKTPSFRSSEETNIVLSDDDSVYYDQEIKSQEKGTSSISIFIKMLVVLIIVVALIYFVFYFIKKKTNVVKSDDDYLRRAAYINIAPGKTVEVITLIDKAYLIGVTEDNITLLGEIKDDELIKAMNISADKKSNTKKPSTFTEVLDMFTNKGNKNKNVFEDVEAQVSNIGKNETIDDNVEININHIEKNADNKTE